MMKTIFYKPGMFLAAILLGIGATATAWAADGGDQVAVMAGTVADGQSSEDATLPPDSKTRAFIRTFAVPDNQSDNTPRPWLGVGVEETSEALAAQLDLKPGEGLVVDYVSTNSPAALAGLEKNDVLVDLDGQMLVDAVQLRKLIQMHATGDDVKISFFHAGKKHSITARLTQTTLADMSPDGSVWPGDLRKLQFQLQDSPDLAGPGKGNLNSEIQLTMQQARTAIQNAMLKSQVATAGANRKLEIINKTLGNLAAGGVSVGKDATVIVKNEGGTVRTMVKKDDTGSYVIVADPAKYLTAHGSDGKLLFDGAIETPAQEQKVPKDVWEKVAPMVEQLDQDSGDIIPEASGAETSQK